MRPPERDVALPASLPTTTSIPRPAWTWLLAACLVSGAGCGSAVKCRQDSDCSTNHCALYSPGAGLCTCVAPRASGCRDDGDCCSSGCDKGVCRCAAPGALCGEPGQCCDGSQCVGGKCGAPVGGACAGDSSCGSNRCSEGRCACAATRGACLDDPGCCGGLLCRTPAGDTPSERTSGVCCLPPGAACSAVDDCCGGATAASCTGGLCVRRSDCASALQPCGTDSDCCSRRCVTFLCSG